MGVIYALVNPQNDTPYYVGLAVDEARRQNDHLRDKPRISTQELLDKGVVPLFIILGEYNNEWLDWAEKAWINRLLTRGIKLDNEINLSRDFTFVSDNDDYQIEITVDENKPKLIYDLMPPYHLTPDGIKDGQTPPAQIQDDFNRMLAKCLK